VITCQSRYPSIKAMPFGAIGGLAANATAVIESVKSNPDK